MHLNDDLIARYNTKSYSFLVQSAYYTKWEHQFGSRIIADEGTSNVNPVWSEVWKLAVTSKVKIFIWRTLKGVIPGMAVLSHMHINASPSCPICHPGAEDIRHLLFTCMRARKAWKALGLYNIIDQALAVDRSGSVVLEEILRWPTRKSPVLGQLGLQETVAVASWYIWFERGEARKGVHVRPPFSSDFAIRALTANYAEKNPQEQVNKPGWEKPPPGSYKLNTDAAYFEDGS